MVYIFLFHHSLSYPVQSSPIQNIVFFLPFKSINHRPFFSFSLSLYSSSPQHVCKNTPGKRFHLSRGYYYTFIVHYSVCAVLSGRSQCYLYTYFLFIIFTGLLVGFLLFLSFFYSLGFCQGGGVMHILVSCGGLRCCCFLSWLTLTWCL